MNATRLAVVTGGSKGIGLATASALLRAGHRVVITGRNLDHLQAAQHDLTSSGGSAELPMLQILQLDATDHVATEEQLAALAPNILVANVGTGHSAAVEDTSLEDWSRLMDTNATSAFTAIRAVLPHMRQQGWGRIVTIGSFASHHPIRYGVAYTASKHALWGLTRAVALDCRSSGVTANLVAPAFVRTEMMEENARRIAQATGRTIAQVEDQLGSVSDLGRLIEPDEVADQVLALVDSDRNGELVAIGAAPR